MRNHFRIPCYRRVCSVAHRNQIAVKYHRYAFVDGLSATKMGQVALGREYSQFLVKNLGFFFIPPGVALMLHLDIIKAQLLPIIMASAASTVVVIVVTGWIHQLVRKYQRHGIHQ